MNRAKGLGSTSWLSQDSHGHAKYGTGSAGNNILITMFGSHGCEIYEDGHLVGYRMSSPWGDT